MRRQPRSERKVLRCNHTEAEVWESVADAEGLSFSAWARRTLNAAAGLDARPLTPAEDAEFQAGRALIRDCRTTLAEARS